MMNKKMTRLIIIAVLLFCTVPISADVIFVAVDNDANDLDGSSWELAFTDLQDALDRALTGSAIRVAQGTYRPDRGSGDRTVYIAYCHRQPVDLALADHANSLVGVRKTHARLE